MPLEFKGIKANSLRLMANHDRLNKALAGAVESSDKLISHVGDFKGMSEQMIDDIEFAANVLGNGSGNGSDESEKPKEPIKPSPGQLTPEQLKNASVTQPVPLEVGQALAATFPDTSRDDL